MLDHEACTMTLSRTHKGRFWALLVVGAVSCSKGSRLAPPGDDGADGGPEGGSKLDDGSGPEGGPFVATVLFSGMCTGIDDDGTVVGVDPPTEVPANAGAPPVDEFDAVDATSIPNIFRAGADGKKQPIALPPGVTNPMLPLADWRLPTPRLRGARLFGLGQAIYARLPAGCVAGPDCVAPARNNAAFVMTKGAWSPLAVPGDVIMAYATAGNATGTTVGGYRVDDPAAEGEPVESAAVEGGSHSMPFAIINGSEDRFNATGNGHAVDDANVLNKPRARGKSDANGTAT